MSEGARPSRVPLVAWALMSLLSLFVWFRLQTTDVMGHLDLQVFYGAVGQLMRGGDLYSFAILDNGVPTPFLYPPVAALILMPVAALPYGVAAGAWDLLQLALVIGLLWLVGRGAPPMASWVRRDAALILSWLLMLVSIPVMAVLQLGQLGLILAALVLVDVVVVPPKYRGLLTGLAGAIKLIPLIMLPYYLISRQWRTASMTALGFGGATLIGLWALPGESVKYWTQYAWSTGRFPGIGTERNVSLLGLLQFAQVPGATVWWVVTAAVMMGLGVWGAVRLYGVGEVAMAAILMGVVAGVISPVSWYHHLVWVPLAGAALAYRSRGVERVVGWVILVCSSIGIGVLGFVLRQGGGTDLPVMIGYVLLQLAAGGAVVSHGVRARRSPEREAQHVAG